VVSAALLLISLSAIAGFTAFHSGGMSDLHWRIAIAATAVVAVLYVLLDRRDGAPELDRRTRVLLTALLVYVGIQAIPLPVQVLDVLSPARAEATRALITAGIDQKLATLSVAPSVTLYRLFTIATYIVMFLLSREAGWKLRSNPWLAVTPLVVIAVAESLTGIAQHTAAVTVTPAHGTYVNRNHFSGLLELALPFAVLYPVYTVMQMAQRRPAKSTGGALALISVVAGTTLLVGILFSLSRMGFAVTLLSLFLIAALLVSKYVSHRGRLAAIGSLTVATLLAFIFLPPDELIERFAQLASSDHFKSETRLQLWKETLRLLSDYPVFGCGAGGYESAFLKYQDVVPLTAVEYAHNDYLQWVAELGTIGFLIAAALVALFVQASVLAWRSHPTPAGRMVALACFASFAALLIHSIVEFQSFIPANALMMSWIAGIASSLTIEWEPISMNDLFGRPAVITVSVTSAR